MNKYTGTGVWIVLTKATPKKDQRAVWVNLAGVLTMSRVELKNVGPITELEAPGAVPFYVPVLETPEEILAMAGRASRAAGPELENRRPPIEVGAFLVVAKEIAARASSVEGFAHATIAGTHILEVLQQNGVELVESDQ